MKTRLRLKPGQNGTRKPVQQYGDRLACLRYRCDERTERHYRSVGISVDAEPWPPGPARQRAVVRWDRYSPSWVRIRFG